MHANIGWWIQDTWVLPWHHEGEQRDDVCYLNQGKVSWRHSAHQLTWNQRIKAIKHLGTFRWKCWVKFSSTSFCKCRVVLGKQCESTEINQGRWNHYYVQRGYFPFVLKLKSHASSRKTHHRFFSLIVSTFNSKVNMRLQLTARDCSVIARLFYVCEATKQYKVTNKRWKNI